MGQSIQTIHILGKTPNKVYNPFLKAGLGYKNLECLKKAIAAQTKMYNGEKLHSTKLVTDSPDLEETLKDAEESRLKMRNKMVQINYAKLNVLYETFVPQQDFSMEQTYFSILLLLMKNEMLNAELEKSLRDFKDIQVNLLKGIKILENDYKRSQAQSVESSNSVRRPKSKGTKSNNRVLKNTKSSSAYVRKISRSVSIDSNKCETKDSNVCQTNACVSNSKTVNAVNDGLNIVCVSCGKDVFLLSHEKCVAHYVLSRNSNVKRALFTTLVAAKSKNLRTTFVVAKSKLSVANTPKATKKVSSASSLSHDSSQSDDLLTGSCDPNLYTISISEMAASSPVCLMSKATSIKSWLWHCRLSHLNFEYYVMSSQEVSNNSAANTLDNEHTSSLSSIIVEEDEAPQIVYSSAEQVSNDSNSPVLNANANEFV
nr:integrase, catalytic region, zinc finger, CCHC-type, peptidase aspartic, catalytic [Tanacetum cinerariifolium]